MQHAHEQGIVHRDIKPSNLLVTAPSRGGVVKVADFGLVLLLQPEGATPEGATPEDQPLTYTGMLMGTFQYMAPEQGQDPHRVDIRADLYSLGASFFTLVTGRPPFEGNTTQKLLQHQMRPAPFLCDLDPTFPPQLAEVSGIEMPVPSASFTVRPRQCQQRCACVDSRRPVSRVSALSIVSGKRRRARQYAPVRMLCTRKPSAARCAAHALTARWQESSSSSTCLMNIDSVTAGGYSRSRCSGR